MAESALPAGGTVVLALVTSIVIGFVTAITMVAPLLLDLARDLDVPLGQTGLLAAATALPWAVCSVFAGFLSDRIGRRPMIVIALSGVGLSLLGAALAPSFVALLGFRFLTGVFGAFGPSSVFAAVNEVFPPARRGQAMAWLNVGFGLAAIAAVPGVGAIGGLFGWRWAFATAGLGMLLLALLVRWAFPHLPPTGRGEDVRATLRVMRRVPHLPTVLLANLLERSIFNGAVLFLPPFLMLAYGLNTVEVAPAISGVAVGSIVGSLLGGWLSDRLPRAAVFIVAQVVAGAFGVVLFGVTPGLLISVVLGALFGLVNSASRPAFLVIATDLSPHSRGAVTGLLSFTNQGGGVVGSILGGMLIGTGNYAAFGVAVALGGILAAAMALPLASRPRTGDAE